MAQLALAWVLRERERRLGDRRRVAAGAGARQRLGVGHRARRGDARRDRRAILSVGSAAVPRRKLRSQSRGRRAQPRAPASELRAALARLPVRRSRPSSTRSGAARRSGRCSGRSSSPSCPAYDQPFDPDEVAAGRRSTRRALRERDEIELERESARLWHWRARTTELQADGDVELPERFATFDQLIAATAMRGFEQGLLPAPMRGDFRAYGKVYRHLAPEQHAEAHSIAARAPPRAQLALRRWASRGTTFRSTPDIGVSIVSGHGSHRSLRRPDRPGRRQRPARPDGLRDRARRARPARPRPRPRRLRAPAPGSSTSATPTTTSRRALIEHGGRGRR